MVKAEIRLVKEGKESSGDEIGFPDLGNNLKNIQCPVVNTELYIGPQYLIRHACLVCLYVKRFFTKRTDRPTQSDVFLY